MIELLAKLIIGHFLMDYPLQGDHLAAAKNHRKPLPGVPWWIALIAHSSLQAGMVWFVTGSKTMGLLEFFFHGVIDYAKNDDRLTYGQDQAMHLICKFAYVMAMR